MADGINVNHFIKSNYLNRGGQGTYIFNHQREANNEFAKSHPSAATRMANQNKILDRMEIQFSDMAGIKGEADYLSEEEIRWVAALDKKMGTKGADPNTISIQDLDILQQMKDEGMLPQQQNQGPGTFPEDFAPRNFNKE